MKAVKTMVALVMAVALMVGTASAGLYSNTGGGNWGDQGIWEDGSSGFPDDNTDSATITTGTVGTRDSGGAAYDIPALAAAGITVDGGVLEFTALQTNGNPVTVNSGGRVKLSVNALGTANLFTMTFDGGEWLTKDGSPYGWSTGVNIAVDSGGMVFKGDDTPWGGRTTTFSGTIADASGGSGTITLDPVGGTDVAWMTLTNAANSFSGGVDVKARGTLQVSADGAAGDGPITVRSGGLVRFTADQSAPNAPAVTVETGGVMQLYGGSTPTVNATVTLDGGKILGNNYSFQGGTSTVAGTITLTDDSYLDRGTKTQSILLISAQVTQSGGGRRLTIQTGSTPSRYIDTVTLSNGANNYSGGTVVESGYGKATAAGALGLGNVQVEPGALLQVTVSDTMNAGAELYLDFDGGTSYGVIDLGPVDAVTTVSGLFVGGTGGWDVPLGYTSYGSGEYTSASPGLGSYLTGSGTLLVSQPVAEPAGLGLFGLALLGLKKRRS